MKKVTYKKLFSNCWRIFNNSCTKLKLIFHSYDGSINLNTMLSQSSISKILVICDDVLCHVTLEEVMLEESFIAEIILRLAPYSSMLNPIDNVWNVVKSQLRLNLNCLSNKDPYKQILNNERRMIILENIVIAPVTNFTQQNCRSFVMVTEKICVQALEGQNSKWFLTLLNFSCLLISKLLWSVKQTGNFRKR